MYVSVRGHVVNVDAGVYVVLFGKYTRLKYQSLQSPLLGCRGQSRKNHQCSHPVSPQPHFHCVSNYCSQTQIKYQVELQSRGTWMGGGLKREVGVFLVKEREVERWKESRIASLYQPPSS